MRTYILAACAALAILAGAVWAFGHALDSGAPLGSFAGTSPAGHACSVNRPGACRAAVYPPHGRCFPVREWSADPTRLPCAEIRRVYEDGSVRLAVTDGDGTVRYTLGIGVPNGYERAHR